MKDVLVLIDIQNDYFPKGRFPLAGMSAAARNAAILLADYRAAGKTVIHVRHIAEKSDARFFLPGTSGAEIHSSVRPLVGETVIVKHKPNSFALTGLDDLLRSLGAEELHFAGAMTNMCVDSTARAAFDLGYAVVVHGKACAARPLLGTKLIHRLFLANLGAAFARIVQAFPDRLRPLLIPSYARLRGTACACPGPAGSRERALSDRWKSSPLRRMIDVCAY